MLIAGLWDSLQSYNLGDPWAQPEEVRNAALEGNVNMYRQQ